MMVIIMMAIMVLIMVLMKISNKLITLGAHPQDNFLRNLDVLSQAYVLQDL